MKNKLHNTFAWLCLTAALSVRVATAEPTPTHPVVIRAGKLLDVDAGRMLSNQLVLIRDGRIQLVAPAEGGTPQIPQDATVIDLSQKTVLPGLIDCHTHLADPAGGEPLSLLRKSAVETAYAAIPNARATLLAGFTTVRDVGVYRAFNDVAMRDAIAQGIIVGPRMYVAGAYVTISEGAGAMTGLPPDIQLPPTTGSALRMDPGRCAKKSASSLIAVQITSRS